MVIICGVSFLFARQERRDQEVSYQWPAFDTSVINEGTG